MRASSFQYPRLLIAIPVIGLLTMVSSVWADPPFPDPDPGSDPLELPEPPDPQEHTAQDDGGVPVEEDHTAQDEEDPPPSPFDGKEKKPDPENRESPNPRKGNLPPDMNKGPRFDAPLVDLLDIGSSNAPDARIYLPADGGVDQFTFDVNPVYSDDFVITRISSNAVPTPGALVVIGLGTLALRRRRRH